MMEFDQLVGSLQTSLGSQLPSLLGALGVLVLGWIAALIVRAAANRILHMAKLNQKVSNATGQSVNVEGPVAIGLFWLVLLITLVAVLNALDLQSISEPFADLVGRITGYLPNLVAGAALSLVVWLIATVLRALSTRALAATTLDERLSAEAGVAPISNNLGDVLFWIVILLFLPAILSAFELHGLLEPVQAMVDKGLEIVPNVFAAAVIGFVGWLVATILRGLVSKLLAVAGADELGRRVGMADTLSLSRLAGTLVFILVFVPALIAALDALRIDAISRPATDMLNRFFTVVPDIVAAAVILLVTWYVARFAASLIARLLAGVGFDLLPQKLGMTHAFSEGNTASVVVGRVAMFFAMLFATVEAANRLGFTQVRDVVTMFITFGGDVLLGGVILVIGFWLANVAHGAIDKASGAHSSGLAKVARFAILGVVIAMGLRAMGIADDIVNLAFGLTLGAIAVAVALSFGLGGREAAGRQMEHWLASWRKEK
jgi:hypothetical protein